MPEKKNILIDYWPQLIYIIGLAFAAGVTHGEIKELFFRSSDMQERMDKKVKIQNNHEVRIQELEKCDH
jgi:hypothetical protein